MESGVLAVNGRWLVAGLQRRAGQAKVSEVIALTGALLAPERRLMASAQRSSSGHHSGRRFGRNHPLKPKGRFGLTSSATKTGFGLHPL